MSLNYVEFEKPIAELEARIAELRAVNTDNSPNISQEIDRLEKQSRKLTRSVFSKLTAEQIIQVARHPLRPYFTDYIERIFTDFDELFGDRQSGKGGSIIGGVARFDDQPVMIIGTQKGRKTVEKLARNFGMPQPEDYRKALRLMEMAEKFKLPILTFIDTSGAYPGIVAEERNQSEAIARNLLVMSQLKTPIIVTILGEGGSGGALALAVGDCLMMLQYSIFSVISPEGCASILWRDPAKAAEAADALGVTAERLNNLGVVDKIIEEPLGGAHRNYDEVARSLKIALQQKLQELKSISLDKLVAKRYQKWIGFGRK